MNKFPKVGLNTSQIYSYEDVHGGCRVFFPINSPEDPLKKEIESWAKQQEWELNHGNSVA